MKVRMKLTVSGGRADGTSWPVAGDVLEVGDAEGAELCAAGIAEPVAEHRAAETPEDTLPDAETRAEESHAAAPGTKHTPSRAAAARQRGAQGRT